jgi:YHS domain-containing protein
MKINYSTVAAALVATITLPVPIAKSYAQVPTAPKATVAMTFAKAGEAWQGILADRKALAAVIRTGKLSEAHDLAFSIRDAVVTLPYKSGSLAPAKKAALQKQVAVVAGIAENIDKYGDAGNAAKTKAEYAKLVKALNAIESLYPVNALPTSGEKPISAADKALFLTPGGLYTNADIAANGSTSAYLKYASVIPNHDTQVKAGEAVCPISETKPNPQLTWVIGGKTYTFCCPPCIAEFVQKAKTAPQSIKAPDAYVKK